MMATTSSTSSSTSSALAEIVAHPRVETRRTISPYDLTSAKTIEEVRKEREEDKLHQFLMGLDETLYGAIKSNLLSRVPLPTLEEAYNALTLDEEAKHLSRDNDVRGDGVSIAVQANSPRVACTICGRTGHIADNCFRKIGYPEWWGENPKPNSNFRGKSGNNSSKGNSNHGGVGRGTTTTSVGSMMGKNTNSAQVNNVFTNSAPVNTVLSHNPPLTSADRVGISGLNNDQWNLLVKLLEERRTNPAVHQSGKVSVSHDVVFQESVFPFPADQSSSSQSLSSQPRLVANELVIDSDQFDDFNQNSPEELIDTTSTSTVSPVNSHDQTLSPPSHIPETAANSTQPESVSVSDTIETQ
ncbi:unnamed protein product [Arabidopsis halleri]